MIICCITKTTIPLKYVSKYNSYNIAEHKFCSAGGPHTKKKYTNGASLLTSIMQSGQAIIIIIILRWSEVHLNTIGNRLIRLHHLHCQSVRHGQLLQKEIFIYRQESSHSRVGIHSGFLFHKRRCTSKISISREAGHLNWP
jgi:hypothetical protein